LLQRAHREVTACEEPDHWHCGLLRTRASGHVAPPPSSVMNSRRLTGSPSKPRITPYHIIKKAMLCKTAFWSTRFPGQQQASTVRLRYFRFAPISGPYLNSDSALSLLSRAIGPAEPSAFAFCDW